MSQAVCTIDEVAYYFVHKNNQLEDGCLKESFNNKKLQKILYFAQAWYLGIYKRPLFDDDFEAWIHGPVNPKMYRKFRSFSSSRIKINALSPEKFNSIPDDEMGFLDSIFKVYGKYDSDFLETLSHNDPCWINARNYLPESFPSQNAISKNEMLKVYSEKYERQQ